MTATVAEPTEIAELTAVGKKNQHNIKLIWMGTNT